MSRYKLTIEYDGSSFRGWQMQKGQPTIQGKLYEACNKVFKTDNFELYGAGRTDAGVHALAQVAHLEVTTELPTQQIMYKLNDELPASICIKSVEKAHARFHARYDAVARSYVYQIAKRRTAFGKPFVWWIRDDLNLAKMRKASEIFIGMKDYMSFGESEDEKGSTKVEIKSVDIREVGDSIYIHIVGSHFLWKMVRRIVGVLVEVGRGKMREDVINSYFETFSKEPAKYTAPPSGLYLEHVYYGGEKIAEKPQLLINIT